MEFVDSNKDAILTSGEGFDEHVLAKTPPERLLVRTTPAMYRSLRKLFPNDVGSFKNILDKKMLEGPFKGPEKEAVPQEQDGATSMAGNVPHQPTVGSLVKEEVFRTGSLADDTLCNSPIPLATSTAKKAVTTQSCTSVTKSLSHSESSVKTQNTTNGTFKHPGTFIPKKCGKKLGKTSLGTVSKELSKTSLGNVRKTSLGNVSKKETNDKPAAVMVPNLPAVNSQNISVSSENSIISNASSFGLIPDELLHSGLDSLLNSFNQNNIGSATAAAAAANLSQSSRLSDIELARRHVLGNVDNTQRKLSIANNSRLDVTQAFLRMQILSMGDGSKQPPILFKDEELKMLDREFELEDPEEAKPTLNFPADNVKEMSLASSKSFARTNFPHVDPDIPRADILKMTPKIDNGLEEMSYCSTIGRSFDGRTSSFCLEKALCQMAENVPVAGGQAPRVSEVSVQEKWMNQLNSTLLSSVDNLNPLNIQTFLDEPFETDLAYRADFDNYVDNLQGGSGFGDQAEDFDFDRGPSQLDEDEAELNGKKDCSDYDKCLEVPLARDLSDWSYRSHLSFINQGEKERISVGAYMRIGSENLPNSFLPNKSMPTTDLPVLESPTDVESSAASVQQQQDVEQPLHTSIQMNRENLVATDSEQNSSVPFCEQLEISDDDEDGSNNNRDALQSGGCQDDDVTLVSQSLVSNSLISDVINGASLSLSSNEIMSRFVSHLNNRCRSKSNIQKKESSHQTDSRYCKTEPTQGDASQRNNGGLEWNSSLHQLHIDSTEGLNPSQIALHSLNEEVQLAESSVSVSSTDTLKDSSSLDPNSTHIQRLLLSSAPHVTNNQKVPLSSVPSSRCTQKVLLSPPSSRDTQKVASLSAPSSRCTQQIPFSSAPSSRSTQKVLLSSAPISTHLHATPSSMPSSTRSVASSAPMATHVSRTTLSSATPVNIPKSTFPPRISFNHSLRTVPPPGVPATSSMRTVPATGSMQTVLPPGVHTTHSMQTLPATVSMQSRSFSGAVSTRSMRTVPSSEIFNINTVSNMSSLETPTTTTTSTTTTIPISTTIAGSEPWRTVHSAPVISSKTHKYVSSPVFDSNCSQISNDLQYKPDGVNCLDPLKGKAKTYVRGICNYQPRHQERSRTDAGEDNLQCHLSFNDKPINNSQANLSSSSKTKPEAIRLSAASVEPFCGNKKFSDNTMHPRKGLGGPGSDDYLGQHADTAKQGLNCEGIDESKLWKTIIEEPFEQTQLNPFISVLAADQPDHNKSCGSVLAGPNLAARTQRKYVLEVASQSKFSDCCIGISERSFITIRNLDKYWVECNIELIHILVNGQEVGTTDYSPFLLKPQVALSPFEVKEYEVIFSPQEPGSYMADVKVEAFAQVTRDLLAVNMAGPESHNVQLIAVADAPRLHIEPKSLDFGKQSWGTCNSLPVRLANKSSAKLPLRLVISSQGVFRWDRYSVVQNVREDCNYTVSNNTICSLTLPGSQAGCMLNMPRFEVFCDLAKKSALKDNTKSVSFVGLVEIQLDVPRSLPPLAIINLTVIAGIFKLQIVNGVDLIKMETSLMMRCSHKLTLLNSGTVDLSVNFYVNKSRNVFSLDSQHKSISVGQVDSIDVRFEPTDESVNDYSMELVIFLQPSGPAYGIPVHGEVVAHSQLKPKIVSNASNLNFGAVILGDKKEITLNLKNGSNVTAKLNLFISSDLNSFKLSVMKSHTLLSESKSIVIPPSEVYPLTVVFSPTQPCCVNGKINIFMSSGRSFKLVIPLFGYGAKSDIRLVEPYSGVLELKLAPVPSVKDTFTVRNVGFRDGFFCIKVFLDTEETLLADNALISVKPENGILKPNERRNVTLTCNEVAITSLPVYISIYHGDEVARQQMKRIVTKVGTRAKQNWKYCMWFMTAFADEDTTQQINYNVGLCDESGLSVFFGHLSTINVTVKLYTYSNDVIVNRWNRSRICSKSQMSDKERNTIVLSPSIMEDVAKAPVVSGYSSYLNEHVEATLSTDVTPGANPPATEVAQGDSLLNLSSCTSSMPQSLTNKGSVTSPSSKKSWVLNPSQLVLQCNDLQTFYIINFCEIPLRFHLCWPTDKLNVSKNQVEVAPHGVEDIFVSFTETPAIEEIYISVTTGSEFSEVHVLPNPLGADTSSHRAPLQPISMNVPDDRANSIPTKLSARRPVTTNSLSATKLSANTPMIASSVSSTKLNAERPLTPNSLSSTILCAERSKTTNTVSPVVQKDHVTVHQSDDIQAGTELQPPHPCDTLLVNCDDGVISHHPINVSLTATNIEFNLEESSKLSCNYVELTNHTQQAVRWTVDNQVAFPYFSNEQGKKTVMKSYDMFKIFEYTGTLSGGQTYQIPIIFYPQVFLDCTFVCHQHCLLHLNSLTDDTHLTHAFTLQAFLDNDVLNPKVASSAAIIFMPSLNNPNLNLEMKPNVMAFYPCRLGETMTAKVIIKNRNLHSIKLAVSDRDGDSPFCANVKSFTLNSKKLVKLPIYFTPNCRGFVQRRMVFSSETHSLTLLLFGVGI